LENDAIQQEAATHRASASGAVGSFPIE
jgi:hypothetical protein